MAKIEFYFDEMMPRGAAEGLVERGFSVTMSVDVGMVEKDDLTEHLVYATEQGRVLITRDKPFATRALSAKEHAGVICWTGLPNNIGGMVRLVIEFAQEYTSEQVNGRVFSLK